MSVNFPTLPQVVFDVASEKLNDTHVFMQYGCSLLTEIAVDLDSIKAVIAVESVKDISDQLFEQTSNKEKLHLIYANIGRVDGNGKPVDESQFKQFHQYMVLPWALADKYNQMPDLILINGPFKVASFLYSLICAKEGTTILFNEFFTDNAYGIVRDYALLESRHGDMAEFTVHKNFVMSELAAMIAKYSVIA